MRQGGVSGEGIVADRFDAAGDPHACQRRISRERRIPDGQNTLADLHTCQGGVAIKGAGANEDHAIGNRHARNGGVPCECILAYHRDGHPADDRWNIDNATKALVARDRGLRENKITFC